MRTQINMKKRNKILLIIFLLMAGIGWYWLGIVMDKNIDREYETFYKSNLDGFIESISVKYHGTLLKLKGVNQKYLFYPKTDYISNEGKIFRYIAQKGDYVKKLAYSDSLFLIKNGKIYKYAFSGNP
jgi:hypothetical protein